MSVQVKDLYSSSALEEGLIPKNINLEKTYDFIY